MLLLLVATSLRGETLSDIVVNDARYQELRIALQKANLLDALAGPGPLTLFAPPDEAFNALDPQYFAALFNNTNVLVPTMLYHALDGAFSDADLPARTYETLEGNTIQVSELDGNKFVNDFELLAVDRLADNGVLHEVAGVLIPPPPPPIQISSQRDTDQIQLSWTGGMGPFRVEKKADLNMPGWALEGFVTSERFAAVSLDDGNGFFRIVDTLKLGAGLQASFVVPPLSQPGFGGGQFSLLGDRLTYSITYAGLESPVTAAHIHGPADMDETAGILFTLIPDKAAAGQTSGNIPSHGGIRTDAVSEELIQALLQGKAYLNFHTEANPDGAIRGQILPLP